MLNTLLNGVKQYKIGCYTAESISQTVPLVLINMMLITGFNYRDEYVHVYYDGDKLLEFQKLLREAIRNDAFDTLDNIILDFFTNIKGYSGVHGNLSINFDTAETLKFVTICNSFKGGSWNDIVAPFIDALCDLLTTGQVHGY